ncbi:MAG: hypothetical protein KBS83_05475, partial [Lachnospiraceae bacterium]|nr:hypothetical protein [Candidatus Equihabitans merdae]
NKEGGSSLNVYMETSGDSYGTTNFANVSLKSPLDTVTWGSLNPQIYRKAVPTISEMNNTTCVIINEYMMSATNDGGDTEIYRVEEYYRMRYGTDRIRLLDFNRRAVQVFDPSDSGVVDVSSIALGVTASDALSVDTDDHGDVIAFVKDGALWSYSRSAEKITRIFTFHDDSDKGDLRDDHDEYDIKVVRVKSGGDVDFVVCGYMNRGRYEGHQGILVCRYLAESSCVEERAFIEDQRGYELLENDLQRLNYITPSDFYYGYLAGNILKVDLANQETEVLLSGINPDRLKVSQKGDQIAYANEMRGETSPSLTVMTLDDGYSRTIEAGDNCYLQALGFINDDFVYGEARHDDLRRKLSGELIFAMHRLAIEDKTGEEVLNYEKDGVWITDVEITSGLIELNRVVRDGEGNYHGTDTDNIMNNQQAATLPYTLKNGSNNRQGRTTTISLEKHMTNLKPLVMSVPFRFLSEGMLSSGVEYNVTVPLYYVYGQGKLKEVTTKPYEAVLAADELKGIALNGEGQYIYERGNKADENEIANEYIPEAMKTPTLNANELQERIGDAGTVLDLSGCSLDQVLYQVSLGRPVLGRFMDGSVAMIVGYNKYNTRLYDFATGEHIWYGINDSTEAFTAGGNIFLTVVEPQATIKE